MKPLILTAMVLQAGMLLAQTGPGFQNQQQSTGAVGIVPGQTARLNVFYPTAPAPILQVTCSVNLVIADDQGGALKSGGIAALVAGKSVHIDVNADTDLASRNRTQIHGFSIAANSCHVVATLEIFDNATQKTVVVVSGETTYPFAQTPAPPPIQPVMNNFPVNGQ